MIRKYRYGTPFDTEALTEKIETTKGVLPYGEVSQEEGFVFTYIMDEDDIVYGLGEANRGINKRGYCYISNCTDDPVHTEDKRSLYGAHNFIVVSGKRTFGLFFDYPSKLTFDIGYDREDTLKVSCENADLDIYVLEGENAYDIVKQFRHVIGRSYIPPKFAFGFGQSRWGYTTKEDFRTVAKGYRENHIPHEAEILPKSYPANHQIPDGLQRIPAWDRRFPGNKTHTYPFSDFHCPLIHAEYHGLSRTPKHSRNRLIILLHTDTGIDDKKNHICLFHGKLLLLADTIGYLIRFITKLNTARVNHGKLTIQPAHVTVNTIPRHTGDIFNN